MVFRRKCRRRLLRSHSLTHNRPKSERRGAAAAYRIPLLFARSGKLWNVLCKYTNTSGGRVRCCTYSHVCASATAEFHNLICILRCARSPIEHKMCEFRSSKHKHSDRGPVRGDRIDDAQYGGRRLKVFGIFHSGGRYLLVTRIDPCGLLVNMINKINLPIKVGVNLPAEW